MGNTNSRKLDPQIPPLYFKSNVHGENIIISDDKKYARRIRSYCKGICFTNRPILMNEILSVKIIDTSDKWSGGLRLGFTTIEPNENPLCKNNDTLQYNIHMTTMLPKYACPTLSSKSGNWIKAIITEFIERDNCISLCIDNHGYVHHWINELYKGVFLQGLPMKNKFWAIFDIYGNTLSLELIYPSFVHLHSSNISYDTPDQMKICINDLDRGFNMSEKSNYGENIKLSLKQSNILNMESKTLKMIPFVVKDKKILSHISTYYNMAKDSNDPLFFISLPFHSHPCARGKNVQLHSLTLNSLSNKKQCSKSVITFSNNNINSTKSNKEGNNINDLIIASRFNNEFCNSYVFTARPIDLYEKIIIKVCGVNNSYVGSLAFGLTSCDPSKINPKGSLPDEANFLVDRSEYWVVMKDIISILKLGDEIAFYIDNKGQVNLEKNGFLIGNVIYVDITQSLWAFWDLYGSIQNIHILGSYRVTFDINQLNLQQNESVQFSFSAPSIINNLLINSETNSSSSLPLNRQINIKNRVKRNSYKQVDLLEQPKIDSLIPNGIYDISPRFVYDLINKVPTTQLPDISDNLQANYIETKSHKIVNGLDINNHIDFNVEIPTSVCSRRPIKNDKKESTLETINGTLCEGVNNKDTLTPLLRREQECVVCYEPNVDCILYPCGHACMCYVCASQTWKMTLPSIHTSMPTYTTFNMPYNLPSLGLCPICRDSIKDVVKIYLP